METTWEQPPEAQEVPEMREGLFRCFPVEWTVGRCGATPSPAGRCSAGWRMAFGCDARRNAG